MRTRGGKGREGDRARAGSTDRSRSATKKVWMDCTHQDCILLARVAPGSRLTPAKEDEAGRRGSDAAAGLRRLHPATAMPPSPPSPPLDRSTIALCRSIANRIGPRTFNPRHILRSQPLMQGTRVNRIKRRIDGRLVRTE